MNTEKENEIYPVQPAPFAPPPYAPPIIVGITNRIVRW